MLWRIFVTEAGCQAWCDQQFVALARRRAVESAGVLWDFMQGRRPVNVAQLPDAAITATRFPLMGRNAATGRWNTTSGFTTAWATAQPTADGRWAAPCLDPNDPNGQPEPAWPISPDMP